MNYDVKKKLTELLNNVQLVNYPQILDYDHPNKIIFNRDQPLPYSRRPYSRRLESWD